METTTQLESILIIIATYIGPSLLGFLTVWLQHRKNKADFIKTIADAEKVKKEGNSVEGDIFLKWTLEFKKRLEAVEQRNDTFAKIIEEQDRKIEEQDKIIANQSVLLIDANARIIVLEKENGDLRLKVAELELENKNLKGDC